MTQLPLEVYRIDMKFSLIRVHNAPWEDITQGKL